MSKKKDKKRLLVVEDESMIAKPLVDACRADGFDVLVAKDGKEGLAIALEEHPDLIVLDILMPKMSGLEMRRLLREDAWGRDVPIMFLTNVDQDHRPEGADDEHVTDYVVKSDWRLHDVVKLIRERAEESH